MMDETQRESDQLKAVADTGRYKIRLKDDEPFLPGVRGQVEPYSLDGQVLAAFTDKPSVFKQMLALPFVTRRQAFVDKYGDVAVELDALPLNILQEKLRVAIETRMDLDALHEVKHVEGREATRLVELMAGIDEE